MARDPKFAKRQKERARQEKRVQKAERRADRKAQRAEASRAEDGHDPDIAGIVPGPQRPIWERLDEPPETEEEEEPDAAAQG
ncbi:MAG: hypothetical protein SCH98_00320 [Deferrisomatales bacterium]|nr:hypothetical protein [Deferrisomatales bacterium]